jgi:hypothetical protein
MLIVSLQVPTDTAGIPFFCGPEFTGPECPSTSQRPSFEAILAGDICKEAGQQGWRLKCVWTYLIQDCLNGQETQSAPSAIKSVSRTTNHVSASLSGELSARVFLLRTYTEGRISPLISPPRPISCHRAHAHLSQATTGLDLQYTQYGKPHAVTYNFAQDANLVDLLDSQSESALAEPRQRVIAVRKRNQPMVPCCQPYHHVTHLCHLPRLIELTRISHRRRPA